MYVYQLCKRFDIKYMAPSYNPIILKIDNIKIEKKHILSAWKLIA